MTLAEFLTALSTRLTTVESQVETLSGAPVASADPGLESARAAEELAGLKARIADPTAIIQ
jgi:hypothetical protein